jgi:hypothetical protein
MKLLLHSKGFHPDTNDTNFYKATAEAVGQFQRTHTGSTGKFLVETEGGGVMTEETWLALEGKTDQPDSPFVAPAVILDAESNRRKFLEQFNKRYQQGVREIPDGSNWGDGVETALKFFKLGPAPWCAVEVNYNLHLIGQPQPWGATARVAYIWNIARKNGMAFTINEAQPCPGDLFIQIHGGLRSNGSAPDNDGHMGAVSGAILGGSKAVEVQTFEGNSGNRLRAGQRRVGTLNGYVKMWPDAAFKFKTDGNSSTGGLGDR